MMNAQKLHLVISPFLCSLIKIMINFRISYVVTTTFCPIFTARKF